MGRKFKLSPAAESKAKPEAVAKRKTTGIKRRALAIADERSKENVGQRAEIDRWQLQSNENAEIAGHWQQEAQRAREQVRRLVAAWDSLAPGEYERATVVGWLTFQMKPEIETARKAFVHEQASQSYKWICESCGTLSNDQMCDCTKFGRPGKFIPFEVKR